MNADDPMVVPDDASGLELEDWQASARQLALDLAAANAEVRRLRASPKSLLPFELLADIRVCANNQAGSLAWEPGDRVLDWLGGPP